MGVFEYELPDDLIKQFEELEQTTNKMMKEMTKAGAEVAYQNVMANLPSNLAKSQFKNCIMVTRPYETKKLEIATKVGVYGYFINHNGKKTPAPLVANVYEYGKIGFNKQPFFRKSFNRSQIEQAMKDVQSKYIKE